MTESRSLPDPTQALTPDEQAARLCARLDTIRATLVKLHRPDVGHGATWRQGMLIHWLGVYESVRADLAAINPDLAAHYSLE